jgi:hypothetical protein
VLIAIESYTIPGITSLLIGVLFILSGINLHTIVRRFQEFDHQLRILEAEQDPAKKRDQHSA